MQYELKDKTEIAEIGKLFASVSEVCEGHRWDRVLVVGLRLAFVAMVSAGRSLESCRHTITETLRDWEREAPKVERGDN